MLHIQCKINTKHTKYSSTPSMLIGSICIKNHIIFHVDQRRTLANTIQTTQHYVLKQRENLAYVRRWSSQEKKH